jgi:hypothetical protein
MSSQSEIPNSDCPICHKPVELSRMNCLKCMDCHQKIHSTCENIYTEILKPKHRKNRLWDDILICPSCGEDSIAFCSIPKEDLNDDIKKHLNQVNKKIGGKTNKNRKPNKSRKTKNNRRLKRKNM